MQTVESTKPYLYYEQIINGLVSIPKRFQTYLGNAILVRNEQHRIELENQNVAEAERLAIEEEKGQTDTSKGLFRLPLFGWFSSGNEEGETASQNNVIDVKAVSNEVFNEVPVKDDDGTDEVPNDVSNEVSVKDVKSVSNEVPVQDVKSVSNEVPVNDEVSKNSVNDKVDKTPFDEVVSTVEAPTILAKLSDPCNIRKWHVQEE